MLIGVKIVTVILTLLGVAGTFLPVLPGTPLIAIGALLYGLVTHFQQITLLDFGLLVGLSILAEGLEYLMGVFGAKKFGANKAGLLGGTVGVFLGLIFMGPVGIVVGPFFGAILAELFTGRPFREAVRVGVGSLVGVLGGMLLTFLISLVMAGGGLIKIF